MAKTQTVLVTGASGFIAKHIVLQLLNAGYNVVGSIRNLGRSDEVRNAVKPQLKTRDNLEKRLRFVALDLNSDMGWDEAMAGIDAVLHTASPFPMEQPKNEMDLIGPAVDGVKRALNAAHKAGIKRVIVTSSVAAVSYGHQTHKLRYDHTDWTDVNGAGLAAYTKSKTLAEAAAWEFVRETAPEMQLTTVNPALVVGPPLDDHYGTSLQLIERLLRGKDPMLPHVGFAMIDVRDIAAIHVKSLTTPATIGERMLGANGFMWFTDIAQTIKMAHPELKIATRQAPNFMMRILAIFDKSVHSILPELGRQFEISAERTEDMLDMKFIPAPKAVLASAEYVLNSGKV